jgi:hypothetical protein
VGVLLGAGVDPMLTVPALPCREGGRVGGLSLLDDWAGGARDAAAAVAEAEVYGPRVAVAPTGTAKAALVGAISLQSSYVRGGFVPGLGLIGAFPGGGFDILSGNGLGECG